jgi:transposase
MDTRVRRFRKQARAENGGRSGRRRRYSRGLRALAVDYLRQQMKRGASSETVASELGVSGWSLTRWSRGTQVEERSDLRAVEVVAEEGEGSKDLVLTLVTPDGYRIEGLKGLEIRSVLEALR